MNKKVNSITVTFNPDIALLESQWNALAEQLPKIWVIDNGSEAEGKKSIRNLAKKFPQVRLIELDGNYGIGYALNRGIELSLKEKCDFVLLLDHDSLPYPEMVNELVNVYEKTFHTYPKIGAIGPRIWDRKMNEPLRFVGEIPTQNPELLSVTHLFTSGTLIASKTLHDVGLMREDFFIDQVDVEWCIRAKSMGFEIFGTEKARLSHSIGENIFELKWLGKKLIYYTPYRNYYMVRNMILLIKSCFPNWRWKVLNLIQIFQRSLYWILFLDKKWDRIKMISLGLWDGILGRTGKK